MPNQPPLNPDALASAVSGYQYRVHCGRGTEWCPACQGVVEAIIHDYLVVAQPVVNSFDPRVLNRKGWTCGCEPGNYDSCDECQSSCNELANFLNLPEVKP